MPEGFRLQSRHDRCQIHALKASRLSNRKIAMELGRNHSTIDREVARRGGGRGSSFKQDRRKAEKRRSAASTRPRKMAPEHWSLGAEKLG